MTAAPRSLRRMRPAIAALGILALVATANAQNVAINATGAPAVPTAVLDVSSLSHGIFLPRMGTLPAPAALPQGLTVFKTGAAAGFYAVDYGQWMPLAFGNNSWDIYGNYLSNPANPNRDFIGTTDGAAMYFRTNNLHRMRLDAGTGHLGVGYAVGAPASVERLDVNGGLRQYYVPNPGVETSNTFAAGVFRYWSYGNVTGSADNRYGTNERLATIGTSANMPVLGTTKSYPLQYAGHWGNVDGTPMVLGNNIPTVVQPKNNGWRAFENPYTEERTAAWSHYKEAVCAPGNAQITSPNPNIWTYQAPISAAEQALVTPFQRTNINITTWRRQYLFRVGELNLELNQIDGSLPLPTQGLCPGQPINAIAFLVYAAANAPRTLANFDVTVRHAPTGLEDLSGGFDNTADAVNGIPSCSTGMPALWPSATGVTTQVIPLNPPFVWDGEHNILIEVAIKGNLAIPPVVASNPDVRCSNAGFVATYAATAGAIGPADIDPVPVPPASCNNAGNPSTRMKSINPVAGYVVGSTTWRPIVEFQGTVATLSPAATTGTGNFITYPGGLVLEDTTGAIAGIPWGRWRPSAPPGTAYWAYQGDGTISAQRGVFDNASRLSDYVFDRAFDGRVAPKDAEHHGDQHLLSIGQMAAFTRTNRHLPTMKGRSAWNGSGGFSLGDLTNQLWATTETQALYLADLHDKLNVIEILSTERPISTKEFLVARKDLTSMVDLTDAQKARLMADLRKRAPLTSPSR